MDPRKKRREIHDLARRATERAHGETPPPAPRPAAAPVPKHEMACICGQLMRISESFDEKRCACPSCGRKFEVNFVDDPKSGKRILQPMYLDEGEPPTGDTMIMEVPSSSPPSPKPDPAGLLDEALGPAPPAQLTFACPQCSRKILARREAYDRRVRCPDCKTRMVLTVLYDPARKAHFVQPVRISDAPSGDTWLLDR
jgi:DNA-directed RNA polymerase subunit RPC12/RpoP